MNTVVSKLTNWRKRKSARGLNRPYEDILRAVDFIIGVDQLVANLCAKLREFVAARSVHIVLYEPITNRYLARHVCLAETMQQEPHDQTTEGFNFSGSANLIKWLSINKQLLDVAKDRGVLTFLSTSEQELLKSNDIALVVPLFVVSRLSGVMFVGRKISGSTFDQEEIAALSLLTTQCALAIEYASMYEFREDKLKSLFHSDRLSTIGGLAAGAAHEIRNPLTSIKSTLQYLRKDLPEDKRHLADGITQEVDRINCIIQGLLSFSKFSELQLEEVNLEEVINQTLVLLEPEMRRHKITVTKEVGLPGYPITGDNSQLKQVFVNLLLNSIQAMPDGGTIGIKIIRDDQKRQHPFGSESVCILIRDSGPGIPAASLPKVFDPFYTTKVDGTGLGLSISYGIISKHGGEIEISSTSSGANSGTIVVIRLPNAVPKRNE